MSINISIYATKEENNLSHVYWAVKFDHATASELMRPECISGVMAIEFDRITKYSSIQCAMAELMAVNAIVNPSLKDVISIKKLTNSHDVCIQFYQQDSYEAFMQPLADVHPFAKALNSCSTTSRTMLPYCKGKISDDLDKFVINDSAPTETFSAELLQKRVQMKLQGNDYGVTVYAVTSFSKKSFESELIRDQVAYNPFGMLCRFVENCTSEPIERLSSGGNQELAYRINDDDIHILLSSYVSKAEIEPSQKCPDTIMLTYQNNIHERNIHPLMLNEDYSSTKKEYPMDIDIKEMRNRTSVDMKLMLLRNALFFEIKDTGYNGHIRIKKNRGDLEIALMVYKIICDASIRLGNFLSKSPPKLIVETNLQELGESFKDPKVLLNMPSATVVVTNEVALAMAYSAQNRCELVFNENIAVDGCYHFPEIDETTLYFFQCFKRKFAINGRDEYLDKHQLTPHVITRYVQRSSIFKTEYNAMNHIQFDLKSNGYKAVKQDGDFYYFHSKRTKGVYVMKNTSTAPNRYRFTLLTYFETSDLAAYLRGQDLDLKKLNFDNIESEIIYTIDIEEDNLVQKLI
ncbi:hypothetical protein HC723_15705 [Vibrio sp. S11_S32]|uniref:hypothetical protein n=1 Tax=Vibrio sp. S11_S32 TaxID=2720225 RepID=UPI001680272B|nr:hypothetical protein [Vibrio sp. S11_S32]MBD1577843.1 hypothetical protein [Vibrio sp. S11_S32]